MILGSQLGGFEAIDAAVDNGSLISRRYKERIEAEYQRALGRLQGDRHPLIMNNLIGHPAIFPAPYLSQSELDGLSIESSPAPGELLGDSDRPTDDTKPSPPSNDNNTSLAEIEATILDVLKRADGPLTRSEIQKKRQLLKAQPADLIERILNALVTAGVIRDDGNDSTPRYSLGDIS